MKEVNLEHGFLVERNESGSVTKAIRAATIVSVNRADYGEGGKIIRLCHVVTISGGQYSILVDADHIYGLLNPTFAGV